MYAATQNVHEKGHGSPKVTDSASGHAGAACPSAAGSYSPRNRPASSTVAFFFMSSRTLLTVAILATLHGTTGCKGVRKFFLGDPEQVKPTRAEVPAAPETAEPVGIPPSPYASQAPPEPAPTAIRMPDGTLASDEYARAVDLRAHGQLWMAHTTLAPKALSDKGTDAEKRLLGDICKEQGDTVCLAQVEGSLGKGHVDTDLERAEALAKKSPQKARLLLESKLKDGSASEAELKLLQTLCAKQRDTKCVRKVAVALAKMAQ